MFSLLETARTCRVHFGVFLVTEHRLHGNMLLREFWQVNPGSAASERRTVREGPRCLQSVHAPECTLQTRLLVISKPLADDTSFLPDVERLQPLDASPNP